MQTSNSRFIGDKWGGPERFTGVQFHFHSLSEHTVDGKYHDLEMHTVHFPTDSSESGKAGFIAQALGIFWSTDNASMKWEELNQYQKDVINDFFESLNWDKTDGQWFANEVRYGDLVMMVNTDDRWVYKGSVTTPPCASLVYWNVLRTVYPLPPRFLQQFKKQLERDNLQTTGNYRVTGPVDLHDPHVILSGAAGGESSGNEGLVALCIILAVIFAVLQIFILRAACQKKK